MSDEHVVVLCTVGTQEAAERLATLVVERRLAACVNLIPGVLSVYRWQGEVQRDEERLLLMKTRRDRFEALRAVLVEEHPYEVPEVVAIPLLAGHAPYLHWISESVAVP